MFEGPFWLARPTYITDTSATNALFYNTALMHHCYIQRASSINEPAHVKRYLSHRRSAKAQASLRLSAFTSGSLLFGEVVETLRRLQAKYAWLWPGDYACVFDKLHKQDSHEVPFSTYRLKY